MQTEGQPVAGARPGALDLSADQLRIVHGILDRVIPLGQVCAFGSRTTGRARRFSDLDLLVIEPRHLSWAQRADLRDLFEASELPFRVDVVEAEGLAAGMAQRVAGEQVALSAAQPATPFTSR